jgi:hypothetical protein
VGTKGSITGVKRLDNEANNYQLNPVSNSRNVEIHLHFLPCLSIEMILAALPNISEQRSKGISGQQNPEFPEP